MTARRPRSISRALGLAAVLLCASHGEAVAKPLAGPTRKDVELGPNRWDLELARREAALKSVRGKDPAAIVPLLGLLPEVEGEVDPQRLDAVLASVADARGRHPLVRSYARFLQARVQEHRGRLGDAAKRLRAEGYIVGWQIVGPFDNSGRKGETSVYPPETDAFGSAQTFTGKLSGEPLSWRAIDYADAPRGGYVSFDDRLRPNTDVTGYATAWVHVPAAQDVAIAVGTGGPYEVWVDGASVGGGSAYRQSHPLQDTHAARLQAGWNRVLVKVSAQSGAWGFFLRVSAPDGSPIATMKSAAEAPEAWTPREGVRPQGKRPPASIRAALEGRFGEGASAKRAARDGLALLEFYRSVHPFDREDETAVQLARRVTEQAPTARSLWLRAVVERDPGESLTALREGIERARSEGAPSRPLLAHMLLELGWRHQSMGLQARYRDNLEEAHAIAPGDPVVELALIDQAANAGFRWWSLQWLQTLVERNPHATTLRLEYASRLHEAGRTKAALAVLGASGNSSELAGASIDVLLELGEADAAVALARKAADATPGLPERHVAVAQLEESRGDIHASRKAWAKAIALAPHDADLHAALGRLLMRNDELAAAASSLRRSLDLRPQQPAVRDLLASLDATAPSDVFTRYGLDLDKIASKTEIPASWKGKDSAVLRHRVAVKVLPNGLTERLDHRIIRVLDDRGVRSQAVQALSYDPAESIVEVRRARVRRKDGTVEELGEISVVALASAGYRMYYDQRQIRVAFGGLRPGDTLEVAFLRRDVAAKNMFDEYFGDLMPLQGAAPIGKVEYILEAPSDKPIYFNRKGVKKTTEEGGDFTLYRYAAKDVEAITPEGGMPGWVEVADFLHASTYETWNDVGDWYWDLVREQLVVDDAIRDAVAEALAGLPEDATDRQKVDAIYTYVVRNTRYVGLEFGIHGFKPYRTTEIFSRRFGDCKDKASLLKVMLEEVGIEANLVLVRTRDQGVMPSEPASLAVFNHAITYVPAFDLFLDGTAEWSGPSELPASDQGASVLVVRDGKGADYRTIPVSQAKDNVRALEQDVTLSASGSATLEHAVTVRGASASSVRYQFQSAEQRTERMTRALGNAFPGIDVKAVTAPGIDDITRPATLTAKATVPQWATQAGDGLRFKVTGRESGFTSALAPKSTRNYPLVLDVPMEETHTLRYRLPPGYRFSTMPTPASMKTDVGVFSLEVEPTDDGAEVRTRLSLPKRRISPEDYAALRTFLRGVDAALEQDFEVVRAR
ncbi:MAG: DUF3857 domain-containing protein [Nannocystaceae bacterium]|nr:DUF3857 domain-containing protein [bacterium]